MEENIIAKENKFSINEVSPLALAFVGDAVHTMYVRTNIVKDNFYKLATYHKKCSDIVKASNQKKIFEKMQELLTDEEQDVARRARNVHTNTKAKNSTLEEYKKATSYEAVLGYLYLTEQKDRLKMFLEIKG